MGLLSYVRSRTQVNASRADGGTAAASSFMPPRPPRPGAGAPGASSKPKRETGAMPPSSDPKTQVKDPKRDIGYEPYTKNLYSSNEPEKKQGPQRTRGSFGDGQPTSLNGNDERG
jgi:hypothetical protein